MSALDPIAVIATTLDEMARVINELGFRRQPGELAWPKLEPALKVLTDVIRQRAELTFNGCYSDGDVFDLAALLILGRMVARHLYDLRLALQSQPPFGSKLGRRSGP